MTLRSRIGSTILATVATASLLAGSSWAGEAPAPTYQPDWSKVAQLMVQRSLKLAPGERVLLHYDPERDPGLVTALRTEIVRAGGVISAELTWPSADVGQYLDSLSPAQKVQRAHDEDAIYRALFARSDVYLWIHASSYEDLVPRRFEHLIAESKVRAIHSHWFEPPDVAERATARQMYERAIEVDPADLDVVLVDMQAELRGTTVHLTSPAGTDLEFRVPKNAWFHRNTGEASRAKLAHARSVRDREEELPAGVLRTTDVVDANGTLVAVLPESTNAGSVTLTFRNGRIVNAVASGKAAEEFVEWRHKVTGDSDKISELVIGANPFLRPILPSGFMPYYGYGAGIVRIAIGENWESGGKLRTSDHSEQWLFVTDGKLEADGVTVIDNGVLASQEVPR